MTATLSSDLQFGIVTAAPSILLGFFFFFLEEWILNQRWTLTFWEFFF